MAHRGSLKRLKKHRLRPTRGCALPLPCWAFLQKRIAPMRGAPRLRRLRAHVPGSQTCTELHGAADSGVDVPRLALLPGPEGRTLARCRGWGGRSPGFPQAAALPGTPPEHGGSAERAAVGGSARLGRGHGAAEPSAEHRRRAAPPSSPGKRGSERGGSLQPPGPGCLGQRFGRPPGLSPRRLRCPVAARRSRRERDGPARRSSRPRALPARPHLDGWHLPAAAAAAPSWPAPSSGRAAAVAQPEPGHVSGAARGVEWAQGRAQTGPPARAGGGSWHSATLLWQREGGS